MSTKNKHEENEFPTKDELNNSTTKDLKLMCNRHGISASGNKSTLVKRLLGYFRELRDEKAPDETKEKAEKEVTKKDAAEDEYPTKEGLLDTNTKALKMMCNTEGINASGNKNTIVGRLFEHFRELREIKADSPPPDEEKKTDEDSKGDQFPTKEELKNTNTKALKLLCNQHDINSSGNKDTIVKRLCEYFQDLTDEKEEKKKPQPPPPKEVKGRKKSGKKDPQPKQKPKKDKDKTKISDGKGKKGKKEKDAAPVDGMETVDHSHKDEDYPYACSLCNTKLTGKEDECPGCQVTFGESVAALIDHDWDVYEDIPTPEEVKKMGKAQLKEICKLLGFEDKMTVDEMRALILDLIVEEEAESAVVEIIGDDQDSFDPKRALEETNYIRDSLHKYNEALEIYDRIIEWEMSHKRVEGLEEALVQKGICLQYMNEFRKARECYILAQEVNSKNPEIKALLMGVNALDQFYENKDQKNVLDPDASALKDRIHDMLDDDGSAKNKRIVANDYSPGFTETGEKRVEMALPQKKKKKTETVSPAKEKDYTLPQEEGSGHDDEILEEMDEMSQRLQRLKKLKDSIDLGDIEMRSPAGAGIVIDQKVALAQPIEEPEVQEVPQPPQLDAEIVEETKEEQVAEITDEVAEPEPEVITPEVVVEQPAEVEAEIVGEEPPEDAQEEIEAQIIAEEVEAEVEDIPRPKHNPGAEEGIIPTGNTSLDKLINGGFPSSTNVMISAPPFMSKEMILFDFISNGLAKNKPSIIITTGDPIMVIRTKMNQIMPDFDKYEEKEMVAWVDPRSDTIREKFPAEGAKGPEDHHIILKAVDAISNEYIEKNGGCNIVFISLTPIISYRDPKEIKEFLENITSKVEQIKQIGLYGIDSDMHDEAEIKVLEEKMTGIIDIKENQNARSKKDKKLIMIRKMPGCKPSRWVPFTTDENSYRIG